MLHISSCASRNRINIFSPREDLQADETYSDGCEIISPKDIRQTVFRLGGLLT
jgi:hypothetical protein